MSQLRSFAPWIAYPAASALFGWQAGAAVALGFCIVGPAPRRPCRRHRHLPHGRARVLRRVDVRSRTPIRPAVLHRYVPALIPATLAVAAAVSIVVARPFTVTFAKRVAPASSGTRRSSCTSTSCSPACGPRASRSPPRSSRSRSRSHPTPSASCSVRRSPASSCRCASPAGTRPRPAPATPPPRPRPCAPKGAITMTASPITTPFHLDGNYRPVTDRSHGESTSRSKEPSPNTSTAATSATDPTPDPAPRRRIGSTATA